VGDDTWVWTGEANYGGQKIKPKMTMKILSAASCRLKFDTATDGVTGLTFMQARAPKNQELGLIPGICATPRHSFPQPERL
jgi:hypothetical protein